jgi:hypothetical protein
MSKVLERWHQLVQRNDASGLEDLLADDAVFYSPIVHTPQQGKAITQKYLTAAFNALFNDSFRYVREIVGEKDALLEFVVDLDGIQVNGVDLISWNEADRIVEFKVLIRPRKGMDAVGEHMIRALQALG